MLKTNKEKKILNKVIILNFLVSPLSLIYNPINIDLPPNNPIKKGQKCTWKTLSKNATNRMEADQVLKLCSSEFKEKTEWIKEKNSR